VKSEIESEEERTAPSIPHFSFTIQNISVGTFYDLKIWCVSQLGRNCTRSCHYYASHYEESQSLRLFKLGYEIMKVMAQPGNGVY
jgi:hypothetical protein